MFHTFFCFFLEVLPALPYFLNSEFFMPETRFRNGLITGTVCLWTRITGQKWSKHHYFVFVHTFMRWLMFYFSQWKPDFSKLCYAPCNKKDIINSETIFNQHMDFEYYYSRWSVIPNCSGCSWISRGVRHWVYGGIRNCECSKFFEIRNFE